MSVKNFICKAYIWIIIGILIGLFIGFTASGIIKLAIKDIYQTHAFWYCVTALSCVGLGVFLGKDLET